MLPVGCSLPAVWPATHLSVGAVPHPVAGEWQWWGGGMPGFHPAQAPPSGTRYRCIQAAQETEPKQSIP